METPIRHEVERRPERPNGPEWFANPPLENTSLVYSVPFRGEWDNGQVLRMLYAMLSQRVAKGEAFEVELVANHGGLDDFLDDEGGAAFYQTERYRKDRASAFDKIRQTDEAASFLKLVVEMQRLARMALRTNAEAAEQAIRSLVGSIDDPIQKDVLLMAARRAEDISIALLDTTKMDFAGSPYERSELSVIRTIGMDCASLRFEHNRNVAMSLYDTDTIPLDTQTVREVQELYARDPGLTYVFLSMSDQAKGVSRAVSGNPSMSRHIDYNNYVANGSPQITFRLFAYDTLKEISCQTIFGQEDRDTSARLVYHFGSLQEGLLFETSRTLSVSPRVLTADRVDGFMDGRPPGENGYGERATRDLEDDFKRIEEFRREVVERIASLPEREAAVAAGALSLARKNELQRERTQQRMNRLVAAAFLRALENGWIRTEQGKMMVDEDRLTQLQGGKALRFFLRMNPVLVSEVLASPEDIAALRYYSGVDPNHSSAQGEPTRFRLALREYLGDVVSCEELLARGLCREGAGEDGKSVAFIDLRPPESRVSFWHGMTAELLALGHTYRLFFATKRFMGARSESNWPQTWGGPDATLKFKPLDERRAWLKRFEHPVQAVPEHEDAPVSAPATASDPVPPQKSWSDRFSFSSIPGYAVFRRLFGG